MLFLIGFGRSTVAICAVENYRRSHTHDAHIMCRTWTRIDVAARSRRWC